jgi:tRNA dimethylallyltransferase
VDLAIVGPTASGKTALAARIADLRADVALVSVDALAVYRGMDIGTAKPTRRTDPSSRHPWQLVDLADPGEEYSVARFQRAFASVCETIHASGRRAVLVGGTGLYHRAVLDGLELPGRYPAVAARLEQEAASGRSSETLHERLRVLDPVAAGRMEPSNLRRVVRALEVIEGSGRRFSEFGPGLRSYPEIDTVVVGLRVDREVLATRLEQRLRAQMDEGFLDEVRALTVAPGGFSRTAHQAIGYAELLGHLEGRWSLEEAVERALRRLRSFARRQEAWFRRDPRVEWFEADDPSLVEQVLERWETARP